MSFWGKVKECATKIDKVIDCGVGKVNDFERKHLPDMDKKLDQGLDYLVNKTKGLKKPKMSDEQISDKEEKKEEKTPVQVIEKACEVMEDFTEMMQEVVDMPSVKPVDWIPVHIEVIQDSPCQESPTRALRVGVGDRVAFGPAKQTFMGMLKSLKKVNRIPKARVFERQE